MLAALANAVFPVDCPGCGCRGRPVCDDCLAQVHGAPRLPPPVGIANWEAPFAYEGVVRELVARVKYRGERHAVGWLAAQAARVARASLERPEVITWAPTTMARRRARGFDHAELLARRVAAELGAPCCRLLVRNGDVAQTGLAARDRYDGPRFEARPGVAQRVLVVDDVATTGATLRAAARALRAAEPRCTVDAVTVARTPPPR